MSPREDGPRRETADFEPPREGVEKGSVIKPPIRLGSRGEKVREEEKAFGHAVVGWSREE